MKNMRKTILALGLALLLAAPALAVLSPTAKADDSVENVQSLPVMEGIHIYGIILGISLKLL